MRSHVAASSVSVVDAILFEFLAEKLDDVLLGIRRRSGTFLTFLCSFVSVRNKSWPLTLALFIKFLASERQHTTNTPLSGTHALDHTHTLVMWVDKVNSTIATGDDKEVAIR